MPFKIIASQCTSCSACEPECPNVAISEKVNDIHGGGTPNRGAAVSPEWVVSTLMLGAGDIHAKR